jgi:prefoldin subunit 5
VAEPSKKEWDELRADVASHQTTLEVMKKTMEGLEDFKKQAEPNMWLVHWGRVIFGAMAVLCIGGIYTFSQRLKGVEEATNHIRTDHDKLEAQVKEANQKHEKLLQHHNTLRSYVTVMMDRDPKGAPKVPEAIVYRGRIQERSASAITILEPDPGEPARRFTITPKVEVKIAGKVAKVQDLAVGMNAELLHDGTLVWIHADRRSP